MLLTDVAIKNRTTVAMIGLIIVIVIQNEVSEAVIPDEFHISG